MRCAANVVVLASIVTIARSLVISDRRGTPAKDGKELASPKALNSTTPAKDGKELASPKAAAVIGHDTSFYACDSSNVTHQAPHCTVNTTKMKAELQSGLLLFFGCSLDIYAMKHFCTAAQATLVGFENNFAYMAYCTMGGFTLVYVFQPGATAAPYWKDYVGTLSSQQIITQSTKDVVQRFGQEPTAIVIDSSLWDVSSWWQRVGMPAEPYAVPHADITRWCYTDLPQLLDYVGASYPRSRIAFRTAAPVFIGNNYGQNPPIVNEMTKCVRDRTDFVTKKLFSKYHLIDYNKLVEQFFLHHPGPPTNFYEDVLHPGRQLSMGYMNEVLEWVRGFAHPVAR